ncbi:MAG TPA: xanthine dehydrogenase family protein subunit M [Bosea sp. (in: a-proteobacteria)]|jgi:N-methylhydantoinase B|uniref:FAD binding domain-containing protein n=1 Tax=Bosea sp. (in: a-proteobacteria) TaxID=1871050 RepID=UPI002DDDA7FF|nr:xanthine dehydrogenase family protein subunit M [Bosea sp. (in: a-proteobacteria)]HEV2556413.1 xanthine dehydrogenase family protein subunit M [Bosea sp. (in: a-proteobacteria)]
MARYLRPTTLEEALALRAQAGETPLALLAGGTDVYPVRTHKSAWFQPFSRDVLDLGAVPELSGIQHDAAGTRIGATATWSALAEAALPPAFDALKQASRQVGGVQIQNRGTIGGNLCNASPAADGVPPLLALDAEVELTSLRGRRRLPLADFVLGNRRTALEPDEILVAIHVPAQPESARSTFLKLGARAYLVISIASVAAIIATDGAGLVSDARIAVGACSAAPLRLSALQARLIGQPAGDLAALVQPEDLAALAPIDDVRASAAYRRDAALVMVRRALTQLAGKPMEAAA